MCISSVIEPGQEVKSLFVSNLDLLGVYVGGKRNYRQDKKTICKLVQLDCFALARERSPYALTPHCQHVLTRHHRTGQKELISARHEMRQMLKSREQHQTHVHLDHGTHVIPVYIIGTLFTISLLAGLFFACRGRIYSKLGHLSYISSLTQQTRRSSLPQSHIKNYLTIGR